jgi:AbrB family looped-hinge helix DNA binding protein
MMNTEKAVVAEIKARGQLTIPKKIREMRHLEEGQVVTIIPVGDALIVAPKRLELDEARREIRKVLKAANITVEELVEALKEEREGLYQETYGKRSG